MIPLGDLAQRVAESMATQSFAPVEEAVAITEEAALQVDSPFAKIRFSWRPEDQAILDRIRIAGDEVFQQGFEHLIEVVDEFFLQLRVPEQRDGQVVTGSDGRPVWQKKNGRIVESWDQLTGQDVEYILIKLHQLRMSVAPQVNQLKSEALLARHAASDVYDDAWIAVMEGTQGDRTARSNRESRMDRYHAFFRYYIYSTAQTFLDEINSFIKLLENIRFWQVRTQKG